MNRNFESSNKENTPSGAPRCALISPHNECLSMIPPIQLGYLASCLIARGWDVRIFDLKLPDTSEDRAARDIAEWSPRMIGISAMTIQMPSAARLVETFKKTVPGAAILLGGVHATALPEETLLETGAHVIARCEAEATIVKLADAFTSASPELGAIPGITFAENGAIKSTPADAPIGDLDSIPFPAWKMIPPATYSSFTWQLYKRRPVVAPVITSRGCPFPCVFCSVSLMHGKKVRRRSPENVIAEMQLLCTDFSVGEFQVIDDNFTSDKKHAIAVCEQISEKLPGVVWKTPNGIRVDSVDDELISAMKRAGCYEVGLGIESGSPEILARCNKKLDLSIVADRIAIIRRHGIDVYGFFILGLPGETRETIARTIRFMRRGLDYVSLSYCVPYPGSALYAEKFPPGTPHPDWGRFIHYNPFPGQYSLSDAELKHYMKTALLLFYLHPRRAVKLLLKIRSIPLRFTLRLLSRYLGRTKKAQ